MARILERFSTAGRKLSADEKSAVNALNTKYPTVAAKAAPAKRTVLVKRFSRVRTGAKKATTQVVAGKAVKLEVA
jgi:hypothetical protein